VFSFAVLQRIFLEKTVAFSERFISISRYLPPFYLRHLDDVNETGYLIRYMFLYVCKTNIHIHIATVSFYVYVLNFLKVKLLNGILILSMEYLFYIVNALHKAKLVGILDVQYNTV